MSATYIREDLVTESKPINAVNCDEYKVFYYYTENTFEFWFNFKEYGDYSIDDLMFLTIKRKGNFEDLNWDNSNFIKMLHIRDSSSVNLAKKDIGYDCLEELIRIIDDLFTNLNNGNV